MRQGVTVVLADSGDLHAQLRTEPGITIVAEAATSCAVARETVLRHPDVVILDPELDQRAGIAMIKELLRSAPGTAVLACSASEEAGWVSAVIRAGARLPGHALVSAAQRGILGARVDQQ